MRNVLLVLMAFACMLTSCLKDDDVGPPKVSEVLFFMEDVNGEDSLVTEFGKGEEVKILIKTQADLCAIWPGDVHTVMKKTVSDELGEKGADSTDMYGHPVLAQSNDYNDYGLVGARGLKTTLSERGGWYTRYTYPNSGSFELVIVATNHSYDGGNYQRSVFDYGKVTVK